MQYCGVERDTINQEQSNTICKWYIIVYQIYLSNRGNSKSIIILSFNIKVVNVLFFVNSLFNNC